MTWVPLEQRRPEIEVVTENDSLIEYLRHHYAKDRLVDLGEILGGPVWLVVSLEYVHTQTVKNRARFVLSEVKPVEFPK